MVSMTPCHTWVSSTREWMVTAWPWYREPMFSSDTVPFTRNCPEDSTLIKGLGWPLASVAGVSLTSFTTPSTSL